MERQKPSQKPAGASLADIPVPWQDQCKITTQSGCAGGDNETVWDDWRLDPWGFWYSAPLVAWCAKCGHIIEDCRISATPKTENLGAEVGGSELERDQVMVQ